MLTAIRIPRVLATALVGAAWATAGVAMQGLYRTPLADPALVGIGAGAALGAALGMAAGGGLGWCGHGGTVLLVAAAFVAALLAAAVVYRVASSSGRVVVATMLLAGIALSALFAAVTALVVAGSRTAELGTVAFWSLGLFPAWSGATSSSRRSSSSRPSCPGATWAAAGCPGAG